MANEEEKQCGRCGNALDAAAAFCGMCGARYLPDVNATPANHAEARHTAGRACPNCGRALDWDALFCPECGHNCAKI